MSAGSSCFPFISWQNLPDRFRNIARLLACASPELFMDPAADIAACYGTLVTNSPTIARSNSVGLQKTH